MPAYNRQLKDEDGNIIYPIINDGSLQNNSVTTGKIADGAVTESKIDFTTMKKWVPDYSNASSTNLWSNTNTATMTDTGWVACKICGFKANALCEMYINVNGVNVGVDVTEARSPANAVTATVNVFLPVSAGDVVVADFNGANINWRSCIFIPGKWV